MLLRNPFILSHAQLNNGCETAELFYPHNVQGSSQGCSGTAVTVCCVLNMVNLQD